VVCSTKLFSSPHDFVRRGLSEGKFTTLETVELERDYRAACQKMLVSLDLRGVLNRMSEEIAKLHTQLTAEGGRILAGPAHDDALQTYRTMVHNVVAKLDERDQMRKRDVFKEALQDLLQLGEQLGFARKAEPVASKKCKEEAANPGAARVETAVATSVEPAAETGFGAVEKELAELQSQLMQYQGAVQQPQPV
jgi:hypothetical protein